MRSRLIWTTGAGRHLSVIAHRDCSRSIVIGAREGTGTAAAILIQE
jgi:hypothetical protein